MNRMNRWISPIVHWRGLVSHSASTVSVGIVVCEKSYSRLLVSTWIGSIGRNGRKMLAPSTLNMLPKFELARHLDVLDDVAEHSATLEHALLENQQTVLQQDDVRRFLGNVHGAVDRNADVGRLQRRGVVDAVAHEADHMTLALQRPDDALLVRRRPAGQTPSWCARPRPAPLRSSSRSGSRAGCVPPGCPTSLQI